MKECNSLKQFSYLGDELRGVPLKFPIQDSGTKIVKLTTIKIQTQNRVSTNLKPTQLILQISVNNPEMIFLTKGCKFTPI